MMKPSTASQTANTFVRKIFCVTFNVISALVLVGVASNFYITLTDIETGIDTQKNCTFTPSSNGDLSNFCNHIRIWKFCGLYGIFLPGCLAFILGSIALRSAMNEKDGAIGSSHCYELCRCLIISIKIVNSVVLIILWTSKIASTHITGIHGLETASTIFMVLLGLQLIFLFVGRVMLCIVQLIEIRRNQNQAGVW